MTNYEKHKKTINDIWEQKSTVALNKNNNQVLACCEIGCEQCAFQKFYRRRNICSIVGSKWLVAETDLENKEKER